MLKGKILLTLALLVMMCGLVPQAHAQAVFTVTNTADSGVGSLRQAITDANASTGLDTIDFAIPGAGVQTITLVTALPDITDPVIIDGLSQGGDCATWPPTGLLIELSGGGTIANALVVRAGGTGSTITGLVIGSFADGAVSLYGGGSTVSCSYIGTDPTGTLARPTHGVYIGNSSGNVIEGNLISGNDASGIYVEGAGSDNNHIRGNYIGVRLNGADRLQNSNSGVRIAGGGLTGNVVGGTLPEYRNVLSGNVDHGIAIEAGPSGTLILGNYIGTQANGLAAQANRGSGIYIDGSPNNVVGGTEPGARNIISGNTFHGVAIVNEAADGNIVRGNYIGTGVTGTEILGNGRIGIQMRYDPDNNVVGGSGAGEGNLITGNGSDGVYVETGTGNRVLGNSIASNGGLGIDLGTDGVTANDMGDGDIGANNLQNFPVLTSVTVAGTTTTIRGTLNSTSNTEFTLEFFYSQAPDSPPPYPPYPNGEGSVFIGSSTTSTDGSGNASFSPTFPLAIPSGTYVTATATDPNGNTSEFSQVRYAPTAVTLKEFDASPTAQGILLEWVTLADTDNLGFNLYREVCDSGDRTQLNDVLIPGASDPSREHRYTWMDDEARPGITYCYCLEDVSMNGGSVEHGPVFGGPLPYRHYLPLVSR